MIHVSTTKRHEKKRRLGRHVTRFPGICAAAAAYGCHRMSMYQALMGRPGRAMVAFYHAFHAKMEKAREGRAA